MEFDNIGKKCEYCKRQVFLPLQCSDCLQNFCEDHVKPKEHECRSNNNNNKIIPSNNIQNLLIGKCVICKISLTPINEYHCKNCGKKVCLIHRYPETHDCGKITNFEKAQENKNWQNESSGYTRKKRKNRDDDTETKSSEKSIKDESCACCIIF